MEIYTGRKGLVNFKKQLVFWFNVAEFENKLRYI